MTFPADLVEWIATGIVFVLISLAVLFFNVVLCRDAVDTHQCFIREQLNQIKRRANQARDAAQAAEATANEIKETLHRVFRVEDKPE